MWVDENRMQIIISLLIAILSYKIKLIDDRKVNSFEKFKSYRRLLIPEKPDEPDLWLDKDVPFHIMALYKEIRSKNDENSEHIKRSILDYYKDWHDNEDQRARIFWAVIATVIYLIGQPSHLFFDILVPVCVLILYFMSPTTTIFNNPLQNVENDKKSKMSYRRTKCAIEKDILKYESK